MKDASRATAALPGAPQGAGRARLTEGRRSNGTAVRRESGTAKVRLLWCSLFALALFTIALPAFAAPQVWTAPSLVRIGPDEAAGTATDIQLYAAKGETESFQILVKAPTGGLTNVNVVAPNLGGPQCTLYREHYAYISRGSADWSGNQNHPLGAGWYPDGLIPFVNPDTGQDLTGTLDAVPFDLADGKNQPIWVDVYVPRTTAAGSYAGTFQVTSNQGSAAVTLHLTVWNFTLPLKPAMKSLFRYKQSAYARDTQPARELIRHRLMPQFVSTADERSFIDNDGLNGVAVPFYSNSDIGSGSIDPAPSAATFQAEAAKHQPDLPLWCYMADEIGWHTAFYPTIKEWARNMHTAGIDNLITMMPDPALYDDGTGHSAVDIWVLLPKQYDQVPDRVSDVISRGDDVWSYNCLAQDDYSPKWLLDMAPVNYRLQPGFINQSLNLTGLLYWAVDYWSSDPWNDPMPWSPYPAEGLLVYPGDQAGLPGQTIGAVRLKWVRDGVDDYDYIQLLKQAGQGDWALTVSRSVGPDWTSWTRDPVAVEAARRQLGEKLNTLGGGGGTTHDVNVSASASPSTVASGGQTALTASASDSQGHGIASWSWSDGGAGGTFAPSATTQHPSYTAPENTSGANRAITLTVTAVCDGSPAETGTAQTTLTVQPAGSPPPAGHTLTVTAAVTPSAIAVGEEAVLDATATDGLGHEIASWSWSDGGAGGTFSPSATGQNPSYTPPAGSTGLNIALHVTVTCSGSPAATGEATTMLYVAAAVPDAMTDVPPDYWAYPQIMACLQAGIMTGYADSTFQPTLPVTRADMAAFIARGVAGGDENVPPAPSESRFSDVPSDYWALKYIEYLAGLAIVLGYDNGTYRPDGEIDRGQLAVYMARAVATPAGESGLEGYVPPTHPTFFDVPRYFWAYRYIENIAAQGIVRGYDNGTYRPSVTVTRDQMAVYLARAFDLAM